MSAARALLAWVIVFLVGVLVPVTGDARTTAATTSTADDTRTTTELHVRATERDLPTLDRDSPLAAEGGVTAPRSVGAAAASPTTLYKPTQSARHFDFAKVDRFAEAMRNGTWDWSLDKIIVDKSGNIVSGHHRVLAAERAGVQIPESAIHRLPTETARPVYDWSDILGP